MRATRLVPIVRPVAALNALLGRPLVDGCRVTRRTRMAGADVLAAFSALHAATRAPDRFRRDRGCLVADMTHRGAAAHPAVRDAARVTGAAGAEDMRAVCAHVEVLDRGNLRSRGARGSRVGHASMTELASVPSRPTARTA